MAYLRSIFPGCFAAPENAGGAAVAPGIKHFAPWVYDNAALFAIERERVFKDSWQIAGHRGQLLECGDFLAPDLGVERPLILRDGAGELRAFRNSCPEAPHVLTAAASGRLSAINCPVHGLQFDLGGKHKGGRGAADLTRIDLRVVGDLVLVRSARRSSPASSLEDPWADLVLPGGSRLSGTPGEVVISADWKLLVEQCLESAAAAPEVARRGWSATAYARLLGSAVDFGWHARFVTPNHLVESRPDGITILQVLPRGPGRCVLRTHRYTLCAAARPAAALQYLAERLRSQRSRSMIAVAESTQKGLVVLGLQAAQGAGSAAEAAAFRHYLIARVAALGSDRPPAS